MKSAKLSNEELIDLIVFGLKENHIDSSSVPSKKIENIIKRYDELCDDFQAKYVIGELDTFKRAACLLAAINEEDLTEDALSSASVAVDTALKMCERPYWNIGKNYNIPFALKRMNYKEDPYVYEKTKETLTTALAHDSSLPISYYLNLQIYYKVMVNYKDMVKSKQQSFHKEPVDEMSVPKLKSKIHHFFARHKK